TQFVVAVVKTGPCHPEAALPVRRDLRIVVLPGLRPDVARHRHARHLDVAIEEAAASAGRDVIRAKLESTALRARDPDDTSWSREQRHDYADGRFHAVAGRIKV